MLSKNKSFTLVELLIVIIIVGILAAVALPMFTSNVEKAKWVDAVQTLDAMRSACRAYHVEFGQYHTQYYCLNGSGKSSNIPTSLQLDVPDPDAEGRYVYCYDAYVNPVYGRRCGFAVKDENGSGGWTSGESHISIYVDGQLVSSSGAPEF
ncbi:MAG: prepilin-type N-terminal cleavage/methylation domain-containing protein [Candidatus Omnitrophota bacterium]|nr:MAG: prepilin-type N-terminal cleavage/methylation domain-containing protein [Candidatus Omnitrophota bacterium]